MVTMDEDVEGMNYTPIGSKTSQPMMSVRRSTVKWIHDWSFYLARIPERDASVMNSGGKSTNHSSWTSS